MSAILSVGRNLRNQELLAEFLEPHGFRVLAVYTLEEFDRALERPQAYRAALVDLSGYDRRIWQRCERLRAAGVPFAVIAPRPERLGAAGKAAEHGVADRVLAKPLAKDALLAIVRDLAL
ncbi:MAG: response regulator [Gemmatimonadota bacterium]